MREFFLWYHILSAILYPIVATLVALFVENWFRLKFSNDQSAIIVIVAFFFGLVFSIRAYYTNVRIDWKLIFTKSENFESNDSYRLAKFRDTIAHIGWDIVTVAFLVACFIFVVTNLKDEAKQVTDLDTKSVLSSAFFIVYYCSLLALYCKKIYSYHYAKSLGEIYISVEDIILKKHASPN